MTPPIGSVGGTHAMFIVRGDPRTYNLPPKPEVPTTYLKKSVDIVGDRGRIAVSRQCNRISKREPEQRPMSEMPRSGQRS